MFNQLDIHRNERFVKWKGITLKPGDYWGVDENLNDFISRLYVNNNDEVKIISCIKGEWVERFISIDNPIIPLYFRQILSVRNMMRKYPSSAILHQREQTKEKTKHLWAAPFRPYRPLLSQKSTHAQTQQSPTQNSITKLLCSFIFYLGSKFNAF